MKKAVQTLLADLADAPVSAQALKPDQPQSIGTCSLEDTDWSIEPTQFAKTSDYHSPTPTSIPGASVLKALELKALLTINKEVVVVDVLDSWGHVSIPGAFQMSRAGDGRLFGSEKAWFAQALEKLTSGSKTRPLVFLCLSAECWLSYNASLHALEAGYQNVLWFRGGTEAWRSAGLVLAKPEPVRWQLAALRGYQQGMRSRLRAIKTGESVEHRNRSHVGSKLPTLSCCDQVPLATSLPGNRSSL